MDKFCYLGDMLSVGGNADAAVETRIRIGWNKYHCLPISTRNPAVAGMADRTAPVVKLTRQKIIIPSGIGLAAVLAVGQLCLSL